MTNSTKEKIIDYLIQLTDAIIQKSEAFVKRIKKIEENIDEAQKCLQKGDKPGFERKRLEMIEQVTREYPFLDHMEEETQKIQKGFGIEKTYEKRAKQVANNVGGNTIQLNNLIKYLEFETDEQTIKTELVGKQVFFKGHKLPIKGYEQGKILIEGIGSVETKNLARTLEAYVLSVDGMEVSEAMHMITETTNEQQLKQFFKNKILKHNKYKAKIWDYQDRKFHLIIKADNKFVHGWVHANKPALDKAVETLSGYSKEHIQLKLDQVQPFGIRSLTQIEALPPEKQRNFIQALPKWRQFTKEDVELIRNAIPPGLKEVSEISQQTKAETAGVKEEFKKGRKVVAQETSSRI